MARRFSILLRFVLTMVLFLAVPISVFTILIQLQLQDDVQKRVERILQGSLSGFEASLLTELDHVKQKALSMAADPEVLDALGRSEQPEASEDLVVAIRRFLDHGVLLHDPEKGMVFNLGIELREYNALGKDIFKKSETRTASFLQVDQNGIMVFVLTPFLEKEARGRVLVLRYRIHNSVFASLSSTLSMNVSLSDSAKRITWFSNSFDQQGQVKLFGLYDTQRMDAFLNNDKQSTFVREVIGNESSYGLYARSTVPFQFPAVIHISMPVKELEAFDSSLYLISLSGIALTLVLISSAVLVLSVVKPLSFLASEVNQLRNRLRNNEAVGAIKLAYNDEISDVAATFNALVRDLMEGRHKIDEQRAQIVSYAQNLEERVQDRTRELEEARIRAEIASTQKSRFLVNMNHELRTPLNSIAGITELLRFGAYVKDTEYAQVLDRLATSLEEAGNLAPELLRFLHELASSLENELDPKTALLMALMRIIPEEVLPSMDSMTTALAQYAKEEDDAMYKAYGTIHDASESLLNIINEVINLSRIESGVIEVRRDTCKVRDLFSSSMDHAQSYLRVKGKHNRLVLGMELAPEVPEYLYLDGQKIKQVLLNLLTNAIKYTEQGTVAVDISWRPQEANAKAELIIRVHDTGIGIAEKDRDQLFMEFGRIFEVREIEGTGLGLALSRKLVERMGGVVGFESDPGKGSLFWFTVPLP